MAQGKVSRTDITEIIDYFYHSQIEDLQLLRRRVSDCATDRKRLELVQQQFERERNKAKLTENQDLAGTPGLDQERGWMQAQLDAAREVEETAFRASREMQAWIDRLRLSKETFKSDYRLATQPGFPGQGGARALPDERLSTQAAIAKGAMLDALPVETATSGQESG
jgi:hypothetical protein